MSGELQPLPAADRDTVLSLITRAAADPATDVAKLQQLFVLYETMQNRAAEAAYTVAFAAMQPELPIVAERGEIKNRVGEVQSRYALWEDIAEAIRPVLAKHGFALGFAIAQADNMVSVTATLRHREGHREQTTITLPVDNSGSKNAVQAVGSSTQYGMRYTAVALLNLASRGMDDDGVAGGGDAAGDFITDAQRDALQILADTGKADMRRFCEHFKIAHLAELPMRDYRRAESLLMRKVAEQNTPSAPPFPPDVEAAATAKAATSTGRSRGRSDTGEKGGDVTAA